MRSDPELYLFQNAFSNRLQPLGFNFFEMLVVDLMHEFELGVWKALFIHLLRILAAKNPALLHELDQRYACHISSIVIVVHNGVATGKLQHLGEIQFENLGPTFPS
jgi:hypothetical protein